MTFAIGSGTLQPGKRGVIDDQRRPEADEEQADRAVLPSAHQRPSKGNRLHGIGSRVSGLSEGLGLRYPDRCERRQAQRGQQDEAVTASPGRES